MSDTPLTDTEEKFIYQEARNIPGMGFTAKKEGYVSSEFARRLERRIAELITQLPKEIK